MGVPGLRLEPQTLWPAVVAKTERALAAGALHPLATEALRLPDGGVDFVVRAVSNLGRKDAARRSTRAENPFARPEPELYVADVSDTHFGVLNKYNVIEHHLLLVTKQFQHQDTLLSRADCIALWACMSEYPCLAFYNGGAVAGASEPHKHLQLVPTPLADGDHAVPVQALFHDLPRRSGLMNLPDLPFVHMFSWLDHSRHEDALVGGLAIYDRYHDLLETLGLRGVREEGQLWQVAPYNLLLTREWMLLIPRREERYEGVSVNALGFGGSLFVRDGRELEAVKGAGPMEVLAAVGLERR